jgi:hypothetical protein
MTKNQVIKQIRVFCLDCIGNSSDWVENCENEDCALHELRRGKDPYPTKRRSKLAPGSNKKPKSKTLAKE